MEVVTFFLQHLKPAIGILGAHMCDMLDGSVACVMAPKHGFRWTRGLSAFRKKPGRKVTTQRPAELRITLDHRSVVGEYTVATSYCLLLIAKKVLILLIKICY